MAYKSIEIQKKYAKEYRLKHKKETKEYYINHKEKINMQKKKWWERNKDRAKAVRKRYRLVCFNSWIGYIPEETNCEVCGKKIYFRGHDKNETIHFDHKHENCAIKQAPSHWLGKFRRTEKNQRIWESCKFGNLCVSCNKNLPTKNRKEWLRRAVEYTEKL
jgi:hypothetical protein